MAVLEEALLAGFEEEDMFVVLEDVSESTRPAVV